MDLWYPQATIVKPKPANFKLQLLTRHEKQVLHTTEAKTYKPSSDSYYGHQLWPTATAARNSLGVWTIFQHLALNVMSAAMRNLSGGVETNRDGCVQLEIAWTAADAPNMPQALLDCVSDWCWWVHQQTGIPWVAVDDFHFYPPENGIRLGKEPWRLRGDKWDNFRGILGHQHADENVHGDPGKINIRYILDRHAWVPTNPEEEEMLTQWIDKVREAYMTFPPTNKRDPFIHDPAGANYWASTMAKLEAKGDYDGAIQHYTLMCTQLHDEP